MFFRWRQIHISGIRRKKNSTQSDNHKKTSSSRKSDAGMNHYETVSETLENEEIGNFGNNNRLTPHDIMTKQEAAIKDKRAFFQLILIIVAYSIGYIPTTVYQQWTTSVASSEEKAKIDYWFGVFSYLTLRLSECMNPLMYNLGSSILRKETLKLLHKIRICNSETSSS